ncbi:uncharacterized protein ColSpa_06913 [Colletotrichum spaethianum]|uniref:Uncharacterized protein n=1 Tax=Colletotrichum spaethianum TaxID=700344 RepID=A0AA37NYY6_9PEZI|nr:uncharacterized protein ColSpa_06913 [Colletotrichum spaethianum]GKT46732.1 hypothetical protein ColSpa_06913 [Colletotrichum spaethianum]
MKIQSVLLPLGGLLLSSTTATAHVSHIRSELPAPTNSLGDRLRQTVKGPDPRPTSRPEAWGLDTDIDVQSQEKETCGYFSTNGALATVTCTGSGSSVLSCKGTGKWLCGGRYTSCLEPTAPLCKLNSDLHSKTMCW